MRETDRVTEVVRAITDAWRGSRYEELERHFHPEMVLAMPGFEERVEGRAPIIDSYRDFGDKATMHGLEAGEPRVDRVGPTAISAMDFEIDYEYEDTRSHEESTDLLVLHRDDEGWQVVWRTVLMRSSPG